ncbi:unnamed protein product, partial [Polarella glacialis]
VHALWRRFSVAEEAVDKDVCQARTWFKGLGGQCLQPKKVGEDGKLTEFCETHSARSGRAGWQVHGRIDGPIPQAKLKEFNNAASMEPGQPDPEVHVRKKRKLLNRTALE